MKYLKILKVLLVITIIVSVGFFITATDLTQLRSELKSVGPGVIGVLAISALSYLLGAIAWKFCFHRDKAISVKQLFITRTIAENISMFNPTNIVAGETVKYQLLRHVDTTKDDKLQSIILSRTVLITSQVVLAIAMLFWLLSQSTVAVLSFSQILLPLLIVVGVFCILIHVLSAGRLRLWLNENTRLNKLIVRLISIMLELRLFIKKNPKKLALAYMFSVLHWFVGAAELCWILYLLDISPSFIGALAVDMGVILLKSAGGFVPGQLGVEEMGNKWMLGAIGIQGATIWISVSIIRRLRQLCWIVLSALFYFISFHLNKRKYNHGDIICHT